MNRGTPIGPFGAAAVLLAAAGLLMVGGCSLPQAEADPTRFYVLSATTPGAPAAPATNAPVVVLRQVELASYLRTRPLVVRRGGNEVEFRDFARWGEPLEQGVGRVLREELLARGAAAVVTLPGPRPGTTPGSVDLTVRVIACEGAADGAVVFRAAWELAAVGAGERAANPVRGDFRAEGLRWDGKNEGSLAAQLSAAVAGLAGEIATALGKTKD